MLECGESAAATCASAWGTLTRAETWSRIHQRRRTATIVAPATTTATNAAPISRKPPWKTSVAGTIIAPIKPKPATTSVSHTSETATAMDAITAASTSATGFETMSYSETAASNVMYAPAMPVPTATSAEYVVSYRRCNQRPAPNTIPEATPPKATRIPGPIQPRVTARTKKKTTPSSVTMPPANANAFAPIRSAADIVRPQSNPVLTFGCSGGAVGGAAVAGTCTGAGGRGGGAGSACGDGGWGAAARLGAVARPAWSPSTIVCNSETRLSRNATRLARSADLPVVACAD